MLHMGLAMCCGPTANLNNGMEHAYDNPNLGET